MYFGSQRVARAVVSWLATVKGEEVLLDGGMFSRNADAREGFEEAVVTAFGGSASDVEGREGGIDIMQKSESTSRSHCRSSGYWLPAIQDPRRHGLWRAAGARRCGAAGALRFERRIIDRTTSIHCNPHVISSAIVSEWK